MSKPLLAFLILLNLLAISIAKDCATKQKSSHAFGDIASENGLDNCPKEGKNSSKKDSNGIHVLKEIYKEIVKVDEEEKRGSTEIIEKVCFEPVYWRFV